MRGNRVLCAPDEHGEADGVGVLLQRGLRHLLGRLVQAGVDHLEPGVTQRAGDHLRPPVVTVEAGLGDHDAVTPLHCVYPHMAPSRYLARSPWPAPAPRAPDWTPIRWQRSLGSCPRNEATPVC